MGDPCPSTRDGTEPRPQFMKSQKKVQEPSCDYTKGDKKKHRVSGFHATLIDRRIGRRRWELQPHLNDSCIKSVAVGVNEPTGN